MVMLLPVYNLSDCSDDIHRMNGIYVHRDGHEHGEYEKVPVMRVDYSDDELFCFFEYTLHV